MSTGEGVGPSATIRVLTFEVGSFLFGVRAGEVARILPPGQSPEEGVSVIDALGLLGGREKGSEGSCLIVLASATPEGGKVAITGSRAGDVRTIDPESLLPLPSYLFRDGNPFQVVCLPGVKGSGKDSEDRRALFLLAGPERLLARAEAG